MKDLTVFEVEKINTFDKNGNLSEGVRDIIANANSFLALNSICSKVEHKLIRKSVLSLSDINFSCSLGDNSSICS